MALEELLDAIETRARSEIEAELERARCQAEEIGAAEAERAALDLERAITREKARVATELERGLATARRKGRRRVSEARQRVIDRVQVAVVARLTPLLEDPRYLASLPVQLDACQAYVGGAATLEAAPALVPKLQTLAAERGSLTVQPEPMVATGFRLVAEEGRLSIDATLEGALEHHRGELEIALLRELKAVL